MLPRKRHDHESERILNDLDLLSTAFVLLMAAQRSQNHLAGSFSDE